MRLKRGCRGITATLDWNQKRGLKVESHSCICHVMDLIPLSSESGRSRALNAPAMTGGEGDGNGDGNGDGGEEDPEANESRTDERMGMDTKKWPTQLGATRVARAFGAVDGIEVHPRRRSCRGTDGQRIDDWRKKRRRERPVTGG